MSTQLIAFYIVNAIMLLINLPSMHCGFTILYTFKRRKPYPVSEDKLRFAVVIPARNEENVIGNLLEALKKQDYPAELFETYVAINHCTDNTESVTLKHGGKVFRCDDSVRCKGDVLNRVITFLEDKGYAAYAVFDADNLPDPQFLSRVNDAMQSGEFIVKGSLRTGNITNSWVAGGFALYHTICEWCYSRAHTLMGSSSNLVGTGFAFRREVMDALGGWHTRSICEDTELLTLAAEKGYRVAFVPEAISYDEQVEDFPTSLHQRLRWSRGMIENARYYSGRLLFKKTPDRKLAKDVGLLLIVSHLTPLAFPLTVISYLLAPPLLRKGYLISLPLSILALMLVAVIFLLYGRYPLRRCLSTVFLFPVFMISWFVLQLLAIFIPVRQWKPVRHKGQNLS